MFHIGSSTLVRPFNPTMAIQSLSGSLRQLPLVMIPFIVAGCASYRFGNSTLYRPDVRTVHVPVITSSSFRRHLGERLTEAVVKQVELATPYKVVNERQADSVLIVHLVDDSRHTLAETRNELYLGEFWELRVGTKNSRGQTWARGRLQPVSKPSEHSRWPNLTH